DCLVRWYRMQGFDVSWIPGTDHAGIGTQSVVERYLYNKKFLTRHDLGRENFTKKVWEWRELRLGASLDWDNLFFTMDPIRSKAVNNAFIRMFNDGMIYRDTRLVNWCCALGTVISDIESLHGKEVIHPLLNKKMPIICDAELVDMEFGTGVVK
ncbi:14698_t:CDS:2, partial [Dentiscutata erythropus]